MPRFSFKYELMPTGEQQRNMRRFAGSCRFVFNNAELVFAICEAKHVEVVILNWGEDTTFEEDLATDVLEIITVFSARQYGGRSRKNQKRIDGARAAVENA